MGRPPQLLPPVRLEMDFERAGRFIIDAGPYSWGQRAHAARLTLTIKKDDIELPSNLMMGLSEYEAARAWGLSPNQWAKLPPHMKPRPRRIGGRKIYIRVELEQLILQAPFWDSRGTSCSPDEEW